MLQDIARPVLKDPEAAQLRFTARHPLYLRLARLRIDTSGSTPEQTVENLLATLNQSPRTRF